jgi:hypothetical protein
MKGWKNFFASMVVITVVCGCGKYEEGPLLSLRSKNSRIEGKWKVVGYDYEYKNSGAPEENESYSLNGTTMTYQFNDFSFDPLTGELIVTPATDTYSYELTYEFDTKNNEFNSSETTDNTVQTNQSYWSWQDGASSHEMIEIDGQQFVIKKLTNKELILYLDYAESDDVDEITAFIELKFEKE